MSHYYTAARGPGKAPRVTLRRGYCDGKPAPLRRTPFIVQIGITPALDGSFVVEVGGAPSFAVTKFEMRRWPAFRRRLETALRCRVAAMAQAEWEWVIATNKLAPWTAAAEKFAEANDKWFDEAFERHCEWMAAVGADTARRRAERRRA